MPKTLHILYMEDNEGSARLLEKRLSRAGYTIDIAPDGEAGLERIATRTYDIIIVDYNMPGLSGLQVIEHLSEQEETPPTIMLTGTGNERIAVEALKLGAFDYVVKDIDGIYLDLLPTVIEQAKKNQQLIEDKRRAEQALHESEERFRILFEEAPDPYIVSDLEGNLLSCNRALEPLLGISVDDLIGKNVAEMELLSRNQFSKIAGLLKEMSEGKFSNHTEITVTREDGKEVVFDLRTIPIQIQGETQILGIGHDITWRTEVEAQMKAHIDQLEILHRIDDELTRKLDIDYVQAMALDNMMKLSGANVGSIALINESEVLNVHSIGYPEELNRLYTVDNRSIVARAARERQAQWIQDVSTDPDYFNVISETRSQITIPLLSQERLIGIVSLETDQPECFDAEMFEFLQLIATRIAVAIDNAQLFDTRQKQLEELQNLYEQIRSLEQLKTDMIRIVSHDLRNPLAVVTTSTGLLERTLKDTATESQKRYISQVLHSIRRMRDLTTDVLSLENIEQLARGDASTEKIDFTTSIQNIIEDFRMLADQQGKVLNFVPPEEPIPILGNTTELQQATTNLISNAIKYTPEGGNIDVVIRRQDTTVQFEVIDTGYGIPEEVQSKLFQPFQRVQTEETSAIEGTGLGLYIVKKIVERNGGEIIFSSEHGVGSTFGFVFPTISD